jgi:hypothetical protein
MVWAPLFFIFTSAFIRSTVGFLHLATGQFMGDGLCAGLGFLPVVVAVADEVGGRRIAELPGKYFGP